jgi:hypothetical protein
MILLAELNWTPDVLWLYFQLLPTSEALQVWRRAIVWHLVGPVRPGVKRVQVKGAESPDVTEQNGRFPACSPRLRAAGLNTA